MKVTIAERLYSLSFRHVIRGTGRRTRRVTTALVFVQVETQIAGTRVQGLEDVASATVRHHPNDPYSRELGRRYALRRLYEEQAGTEWHGVVGTLIQAYYKRPRLRDPQAIQMDIKRLEAELRERLGA